MLADTVRHNPDQTAIQTHLGAQVSYSELLDLIERIAAGMVSSGLQRNDRVAIYLNKTTEAVAAFFATSLAGGIFIPVNPVLKPDQVVHILKDSQARMLISSGARLTSLGNSLDHCAELKLVVHTDAVSPSPAGSARAAFLAWESLAESKPEKTARSRIDKDVASIFYTVR